MLERGTRRLPRQQETQNCGGGERGRGGAASATRKCSRKVHSGPTRPRLLHACAPAPPLQPLPPQGHRHKIPTAQAGTRTLLSVYVVANEAALLRPGGGAVSQSAQAAEVSNQDFQNLRWGADPPTILPARTN